MNSAHNDSHLFGSNPTSADVVRVMGLILADIATQDAILAHPMGQAHPLYSDAYQARGNLLVDLRMAAARL